MQPPPRPPHGGPPPGFVPPPGPPGSRPPGGGNAMVIVIVAVTAFMVLLGGGVFLLAGGDSDDDPPIRPLAATPTTDLDLPTPPTYSYSPPTFPTPSAPQTTYAPPQMNYGAIAVGSNGAIGKAWDYDSMSAAKRRALNECSGSCKVLTTFVNGCGAVAYNSRTNRYWGGHGSTRAAAQRNALSNAGGGRTVTWVCTTR
ncbi:DUF4189 domain-containing protein [Actinomadura monticuli]|uniref:DUF4189 domain-containing protein n=1 Tax=Actinomadura monticuli TaxID=3097367 RepID=A0ABV4QDE4_9ACTN